MAASTFTKAQRALQYLRLGICGPSGCGKTWSSLAIATGLVPGQRFAVLDTEHGSSELYSHQFDFDVSKLNPPYAPGNYILRIKDAIRMNYPLLIIDSLSHAWAGEGGMLDIHTQATARSQSKNSYISWNEVNPQHQALLNTLLSAPMHIIFTLRAKTVYETITDERGKKSIIKLGLAPVQREGLDYEFTTILDLAVKTHLATTTKDRTGLFEGAEFVPSAETGILLREWLQTNVDGTSVTGAPDLPHQGLAL